MELFQETCVSDSESQNGMTGLWVETSDVNHICENVEGVQCLLVDTTRELSTEAARIHESMVFIMAISKDPPYS